MTPEPIPERVLLFLHREIESVRELETLLALRGSGATTTARALAATMRSGARWTEQQLEGLRAKGLVKVSTDGEGEPGYRYAPRDSELAAIVDAIADAYDRRRSTVIGVIFGDSRQDVLRTFSDAFRLRREDED